MYLITSDETMDPQVIPKRPDKKCSKVTDKFPMKFGSYLCDAMEENIMMRGTLAATANLSCKLMFKGINVLKKEDKRINKYINIGSMLVNYKEDMQISCTKILVGSTCIDAMREEASSHHVVLE